jgi:nucleoid DNA-binding protein
MDLDVDKILHDVAAATNTTKFQNDMILRSIFEMVAETMRDKKAENILLPKFGKFIVPKKKLERKNPELYKMKYPELKLESNEDNN